MPRPRALRLVQLALSVSLIAGCSVYDVDQPIALIPAEDWGGEEVRRLAWAADCWNKGFGTRLVVAPEGSAERQQVEVSFNELICLYANGRVDWTMPMRMLICQPGHKVFRGFPEDTSLATTLLHEMGHVLGILSHAEDPRAVMHPNEFYWLKSGSFDQEDHSLFLEANGGYGSAGPCDRVNIEMFGCSCW